MPEFTQQQSYIALKNAKFRQLWGTIKHELKVKSKIFLHIPKALIFSFNLVYGSSMLLKIWRHQRGISKTTPFFNLAGLKMADFYYAQKILLIVVSLFPKSQGVIKMIKTSVWIDFGECIPHGMVPDL